MSLQIPWLQRGPGEEIGDGLAAAAAAEGSSGGRNKRHQGGPAALCMFQLSDPRRPLIGSK